MHLSNEFLNNLDSLSEDEFELSVNFYFTMANSFNTPAALINSTFEVIQCTDAFLEIIGETRENLLYHSITGYLAESDVELFITSCGNSNEIRSYNFVNTGGTTHALQTKMATFSHRQHINVTFLHFEDITEQLNSSFENFRLKRILEQIPLSIVITDTLGNIEYVNPQFERATGYTMVEVLGQNPRILKSGEMSPEKYQHLWKVITAGKTWRGELHNKRKNGELFWEMASISVIRNEEGKIINYIALKEDITTRKIVYEQMIENEEQLRFMVEATGDVLYKYSHLSTRFEYLNPAIVKLTGYTESEINQIHLSSIILQVEVPEHQESTDDNFNAKKVYGTKGDYRAEYLIQTKHSELKWIEDHSFPWYNAEGELIGSVGILTDISERKAIHQELKRAKDESESMNRLKSNFLANISHELRTPLISILGYSEIVREMVETKEIKELANIINTSANRLTETINLILDLTTLESENEDFELTSFSIQELCELIVPLYQEAANKKNIAFHYNNNLPLSTLISGEYRMLKQVLGQLLDNAVKYTQKGSVSITLSEHGDEEILISVADTGIGIKKEDFSVVFEEFRQVSEGLGRRFEGSGLGLSITKRFVERMRGKIWLESEHGKGSTFFVSLKKS
ncbi:MAG: PAS domain-containing sensor histidine kinase [Ignavibacteria bacterium]|nr:PAS domain-containing sensor histidine kinase [Ignavibacteria bacterium]